MTTIDRLRHPSISEAGTRAAGINPEPIPSGGVTRWTAQARQDRVPRRAADLMDKRARPRSKRPRPRSGRGVRCTRHPCRQASLRVSPRRGAGRPHPPAMGARSVIHWCAAPGPVACRRLGPVCQPAASPLRSRAGTPPAGPALTLWPARLDDSPRVSSYWCPFVVRTHSTVHPEGDTPMPHTIRKNAREWQRLWRGGDVITEIAGDDPGMPRRAPRERKALARPLGLRGRTSTAAPKEPRQ